MALCHSHPDTAAIVEQFVLSSRQARLTKAALETLAIVAYKQPVTRHQISAIRGVNSDGVIRALQDRGLVVEAGREEAPGRPMLYGTSPEFLERLGLPSLAALPSLAPLLGADAAEDDAADAIADADPATTRPGGRRGRRGRVMADMVDGPASEPAECSGGGGAPPARPRPRRSRLPALQRGADRGGPRHRQRDRRDARRQGRPRPRRRRRSTASP